MKRVSCHERLKQLRKELNYDTKKNEPETSTLPVIHLKADKRMKKIRKEMSKKEKANKAAIARDILYNLFEEWYAKELMETMEYEELIDFVIDYAKAWKEQLTDFEVMSLDTLLPEEPFDEDFDIPDDQWDAYVKFEKSQKKSVNGIKDVIKMRKKFKKEVNKKRKHYVKHGLMIYDPLFKHSKVNEQQMVKNLKRISRENEIRTQEFAKMMNKLVGDPVNQKLLKSFEEHTKAVIHQVNKQIKDIRKSAPKIPVPFSIS